MKPAQPSEAGEQAREQVCPSAWCEEGSILLGIIAKDGVVAYVTPRVTVDADFVRSAQRGRAPETRFRFAQMCIQSRCAQWTGCRCGVIDKALVSQAGAEIARSSAGGPLPACAVRSTCRWFAQVGAIGCAVCPFVVHSLETEPSSSGC